MKIFNVVIGIAYLVIGIVQIVATIDGIKEWLGINGLFAGFIAFIVGYIPIVGSICGVFGAHYAWGWGLLPSIALFFWYAPVFATIFIVSRLQDRIGWKRQFQEHVQQTEKMQDKIYKPPFLERFFRGDIPLSIMFWVYGVGVHYLWSFIFQLQPTREFFTSIYLYYGFLGLKAALIICDAMLIIYTALHSVGLWRSASKYAGRTIWIATAKLFAIIWALSIIMNVVDIVNIVKSLEPGTPESIPESRLDGYEKSIDSLLQ